MSGGVHITSLTFFSLLSSLRLPSKWKLNVDMCLCHQSASSNTRVRAWGDLRPWLAWAHTTLILLRMGTGHSLAFGFGKENEEREREGNYLFIWAETEWEGRCTEDWRALFGYFVRSLILHARPLDSFEKWGLSWEVRGWISQREKRKNDPNKNRTVKLSSLPFWPKILASFFSSCSIIRLPICLFIRPCRCRSAQHTFFSTPLVLLCTYPWGAHPSTKSNY